MVFLAGLIILVMRRFKSGPRYCIRLVKHQIPMRCSRRNVDGETFCHGERTQGRVACFGNRTTGWFDSSFPDCAWSSVSRAADCESAGAGTNPDTYPI